MTFIVTISEDISILVNILNKNKCIKIDNITYISTNYSLFKYLLELLETNSISKNKNGYITLKRKDGTTTSLQRIIMEFYSQYDGDLKILLEEKEGDSCKYEIDHINNDKLDNRTGNFQILTHQNNILKTYNSRYQVTSSNKHILELDRKIKNLQQYKVDEKYFKYKSSRFKKMIENNEITNINECCYLDLSSTSITKTTADFTNIRESIICVRNYFIEKMTSRNDIIHKIVELKNKQIAKQILDRNIMKLNRYRSRYSYLDEVILKFSILDSNYDEKIELELYNINDYEYQMSLYKSKHILLDLYRLIVNTNDYTIEDGNIIKSMDISFEFDKKGKYSIFRYMYMLGLLKREKSKSRKSFISIPIYTHELLKEANYRAKKILDLELGKSLTYFLVREEFGKDIATMVYKERENNLSNIYEKYSIRAKQDIIEFLETDEQIRKIGYVTIEEIFENIKYLNEQRRLNGIEYNPIYKGFKSFITKILNYNTDTKKVLESIGFRYVYINKSIINNIVKYQQKNNLDIVITTGLYSRGKAIVLEKLLK